MAEGTCSVAKCDKPVYCKSLCENHYRKFRKYGDPLAGKTHDRLSGTPEERFWPRVDKNGPVQPHRPDLGPCWLWTTTASTKNGYPQFRCGDRMVLTHRFAYENAIGPIPDGFQIDHVCHNQHPACPNGPECPHRKCVNPTHLEVVTNDENQARRAGMNYAKLCRKKLHLMTKDNVRVTASGIRVCATCVPGRRADQHLVCPNGHKRTKKNTRTNTRGSLVCLECQCDLMRRRRTHQVVPVKTYTDLG